MASLVQTYILIFVTNYWIYVLLTNDAIHQFLITDNVNHIELAYFFCC